MWQKLGQHFLKNTKILEATRDAIIPFFVDKTKIGLLEIGPWKGALTRYIQDICDDFLVIEKDETMKPFLKKILKEEQIIVEDILTINNSSLRREWIHQMVVVGNLPYYITSPILRKFFEVKSSPPTPPNPLPPLLKGEGVRGELDYDVSSDMLVAHIKIVWWVFLIQKEVAEKIKTDARKKSYLWRLLNYAYDIEYLFTVPPEDFDPPPKVDSAVIRLTLREKPALSTFSAYEKMKVFLDIVSMYKRKTLWKIAKMRSKDLEKLHITIPEILKGKRLEELGWEEMGKIVG